MPHIHDGRALAALRERFGLESFRPGQAEVVAEVLAGRSALAVFATGAGKSLCYQLPATVLDGLTLVVSPLIALMKDQVDSLARCGVRAARLDSTLAHDQRDAVLARARSGDLELLYVAPERLANERFLGALAGVRVALMAVDEAHCISEWGHNFRPDYLRLPQLARRLGCGAVLALTATATPAVAADLCEKFAISSASVVRTGFYRPNLEFHITPCRAAQRRARLLERVRAVDGAAIVYVTQQLTAESVAGALKRGGVAAMAYHAGLRDDHRARVQDQFMRGETRVVVATVAFGMGVDKADIRAVIHYNLPKSLENYAQETGRAGRDGRPARCEMLACADDTTVLENFVFGDTPTPQALRHLIDHLLRLGDEFDVSPWQLSTINDIRASVVETVLAYLEAGGVIEPVGSFVGAFRVRLLRPLDEALAGYPARRRELLRGLFGEPPGWGGWHQVDTDSAGAHLGVTRAEVEAAVREFATAGDAQLRPAGLRRRYRVRRRPQALAPLVAEMQERFAAREQHDIARLHSVVELAESPGCIPRQLLQYFGEDLGADCGTCSNCSSGAMPRRLPRGAEREIDAAEVAALQELIAERHAALRSPRQLARFLCGISSPAAARAKLAAHEQFGALADVPFADVLALAEAQAMR